MHKARKRFGQNFLTDAGIIERIVNAINPQPSDRLIEIGPGLGALTCPILERCGQLEVIEIDRDIPALLQKNCGHKGKLVIHNTDVLTFDFSQATEPRQLRIIGNLPYNISTPIIFHLVEYIQMIRDMHFMLQKEVVNRLAAMPGSKAYGRLSIMAQYHFRVTPLFLVPATAFDPRPKVESAIVRLVPHSESPLQANNLQAFQQLISTAFSQRRKTLKNVLKTVCSEETIRSAGLDPATRPEQISLNEYVNLCNIIHPEST